MKKILLSFLFLIFSVNGVCGVNLSLFGGERYYLSNTHSPYNEQFSRGARLDFGKAAWPINLALDFYITNHSDLHYINSNLTELDVTLMEIRAGIRKYYGKGIRFMIGGGVENMDYTRKEKSAAGSSRCHAETGFNLFKNGFWAEAGFDYTLGKFVTAGFKLDYSNGHVGCHNRTVDLNAINGGLYLGLTW
jgi:hypothetical protein